MIKPDAECSPIPEPLQELCGWTVWHSAAAHGQDKAKRDARCDRGWDPPTGWGPFESLHLLGPKKKDQTASPQPLGKRMGRMLEGCWSGFQTFFGRHVSAVDSLGRVQAHWAKSSFHFFTSFRPVGWSFSLAVRSSASSKSMPLRAWTPCVTVVCHPWASLACAVTWALRSGAAQVAGRVLRIA